MAGLFATIESWLNLRSSKESRGQILSLYMVTSYLASTLGQLLVNVWSVKGQELFCLGVMLICLSLVPVVLTRVAGPDLSQTKPLSLLRALCHLAAGRGGLARRRPHQRRLLRHGRGLRGAEGMSVFAISIFMGVSLIGGLVMQWPIGWLSDRYDRRTVLLWVLIVIATVCLIEFTLSRVAHPTRWLLIFTGLFGGGAATVYPLAVAHAFDYVERDQMVPASTGMLLAWALGATAGPMLASQCHDARRRLGAVPLSRRGRRCCWRSSSASA